MIELYAYTKEQPELNSDFLTEHNIQHVKSFDGILLGARSISKDYRWVPQAWDMSKDGRPYINISTNFIPRTYTVYDEDAGEALLEAKSTGLQLPDDFINDVQRNVGYSSDASTFRLLQQYPDLEKVESFEPAWGIIRLTEGQPCYISHLETPIWADEETITKMCEIAQALADRFQGITWGEGHLGNDPKILIEQYRGVFETVSNFLGHNSFIISPVEPPYETQ